MMDWLLEFFQANPYPSVAAVFVLCGVGLPLPEEIALISAGYICYLAQTNPEIHAEYIPMVAVCAASTLTGDMIPFAAGRTLGARLLRLRLLRYIVTKERLATFDKWFRRRGDAVIFIARFVPGLRVVAFFAGGTMRMRWSRFLFLDASGILLVAPCFVWVGLHFGDVIDDVVKKVEKFESVALTVVISAAVLGLIWWWLRRRRAKKAMLRGRQEAYVKPRTRDADGETTGETGEAAADTTDGELSSASPSSAVDTNAPSGQAPMGQPPAGESPAGESSAGTEPGEDSGVEPGETSATRPQTAEPASEAASESGQVLPGPGSQAPKTGGRGQPAEES